MGAGVGRADAAKTDDCRRGPTARRSGWARAACQGPAGLVLLLAGTTEADAHTSEGAFVLLLPTGFYLLGGTMAVAASFILLSLAPVEGLRRIAGARLRLGSVPAGDPIWSRAIAFILLIALLLAGFLGSRDPLLNPLPLTVWTLWWVVLVLLQAVFGDLWHAINPWPVPYRLLRAVTGPGRRPSLAYPAWLGYWPAVLGLLAFAWFELVDPAPADPAWLATAILVYGAVTLGGMVLFGEAAWLARAEAFSVFFHLIAQLAPVSTGLSHAAAASPHATAVSPQVAGESPHRRALYLRMPGARLLDLAPLPFSGVAFVLAALSTVSFDGLGRTFWWLGLGGINPLDFPGRSAVMGFMTAGLIGTWLALMVLYLAAIRLGTALGAMLGSGADDARAENNRAGDNRAGDNRALAGALIVSILPISLGYHLAHYLTELLVGLQDVWVMLSDPAGRGWNLLGSRDMHVTTWFLSDYHAVRLIWNLQAAAIVLGHILAVSVAHLIAARNIDRGAGRRERTALLHEMPLAVLMVAYTLFGLWLLATPSAG